jgi:hypothetical protein
LDTVFDFAILCDTIMPYILNLTLSSTYSHRRRLKKGEFNALVRNHTHWVIWEHHLRSQVRLSFEKYFIKNPRYFTEGVEVIQIQSFHSSTVQDDMVDTPKVTSAGMSWNILHASIISFWIHVYHPSP